MDWIEKLLHVNLDGGNGSVELLLFLVAAVAVRAAVNRARRRAPTRRR
jgi:hypothetical protein